MVSAGSSAVTSMSSASRSFTARAYSARLRRWKLREPGAGRTRRLGVDARLEGRGHVGERGALRPLGAGRRHHLRAQLADHLLGQLAILEQPARRRSPPATARRPCRARCGRWRRYLLDGGGVGRASNAGGGRGGRRRGAVRGRGRCRRGAFAGGAGAWRRPGPPEPVARRLARLHRGQPRQRGGGHGDGQRDRHGPRHSFSSWPRLGPRARAARILSVFYTPDRAPRT